MSDFIPLRSYLNQQEGMIQQIQTPKDRTAIVRLTLEKGLETAIRDKEVDIDENRELIVFAEKHRGDFPFPIPTEFTKDNVATYLQKLKPSEQTGFSAFFRFLKSPIAIIRQKIDTLGGHTVRDRFAYLEDPKDHDTLRFRKAVQDYSDRVLPNLPGVEEIRARLTLLRENLVSKIDEAITTPNGIYFARVTGEAGISNLYWRPNPASPEEKLLLDPNTLNSPDKKYIIIGFTPSPKGRYIAVELLINGDNKLRELKILDTQSTPPKVLDTLPKVTSRASWLSDESGFVYVRNPDKIKEMWEDQQIHLHLLGQDPTTDKMLIGGKSSHASYKIESNYSPTIYIAPNSRHLIAAFRKGTDHTHFTIVTASIEDLSKPQINWREVSTLNGTKVSDFALQGNDLYLHTTENPYADQATPKDSNGMIVKVSLNNPDPRINNPEASTIFVPPSDKIISPHFAAQADALYLFEQDIAIQRPARIAYENPGSREYIQGLPSGDAGEYSIRSHLDPRMRGATFNVSQWGGELATYRFDASTKVISPLKLEDRKPFQSVSIASKVVMTTNEDGSPLPITLLYDKDHEPNLDGKNKLDIEGYAAYGTVYSPGWIGSALELRHRAMIEKGWLVAIIHAPGGGELGSVGHEAGGLGKKNNSQKGFVAGIKHLHKLGYSSPEYTAIDGRSAGGFLVGWTAAEDKPLIRAFTMHSGVFDGLRLFHGGAGKINTPEFGDPRIPGQFDFVINSSPYQRFVPNHRYPDGLFIYDNKDTNVDHFHFLKGLAVLRASHPDNVALSMQTSCGHVYAGCDDLEMIDKEAHAIAWLEMEMAKNKK